MSTVVRVERKVVLKKLTYNLTKIQRGQSMQQTNLQKKKDLAKLFEEKKAEKIAKQIKTENCDVVGNICIKNDKGEMALTDAQKHLVWREHYETFLNVEFLSDKESLVLKDPAFAPQPDIEKKQCKICPGQNEERQSFWNI